MSDELRRLSVACVDALQSLGLERAPLGSEGGQLCAVMAAPDPSRRRLRLCICDDFSTFTSVEYSKGTWVELEAQTAALPAEVQHGVLRQALREAARLLPVPEGDAGRYRLLCFRPSTPRAQPTFESFA